MRIYNNNILSIARKSKIFDFEVNFSTYYKCINTAVQEHFLKERSAIQCKADITENENKMDIDIE